MRLGDEALPPLVKRSPYDSRLKENLQRQKLRTVLAKHADQRKQFNTMAASGAKQVHGGKSHEKQSSGWALEGNDSLFQPIHMADELDNNREGDTKETAEKHEILRSIPKVPTHSSKEKIERKAT